MATTLKAGDYSNITLMLPAADFGVAFAAASIAPGEAWVAPEDGAIVGGVLVTNGTVANDSFVKLYNVSEAEDVAGMRLNVGTTEDGKVVNELTPTVTSGYNVTKGDIIAIASEVDASGSIDEPVFISFTFRSAQLTPQANYAG